MAVARKCEQCGRDRHARDLAVDARTPPRTPSSIAGRARTCAWTEFDLVEAEAEPASR